MIPDQFVQLAETLAAQARETAQRTSNEPEVEIKADGTPVTVLDRAVEGALRRVIEQQQPGHGIIGEEFGAEGANREWVWVLDPVDGTRQFAAGLPNFGTLIALCHEGRPVIGVIAHLFYESTCIGVAGRGALFNRRPVRCAGPDRISEVVACISDPDRFDARTTPGMQAIRAHPLERVRRRLPRLRVARTRTSRALPERAEPRTLRHRRTRAGGRSRGRTNH